MAKRGFRNYRQRGGANIDTKAFMESNSMVARAAFCVLVLLAFIILMSFATKFLQWMFSPSKNPKLVDGMKRANEALKIHANPQKDGSKPILRSDDQRYGVEFTWSVWIYINDLQYKRGERKHIFHKGNDKVNPKTGMVEPNQAPGLYLHETKNALVVKMNTFKSYGEEVLIPDIPIHKWINVMIRIEGNIMDIYINGAIAVRHILAEVVKQNYGDTHTGLNGGFSGNVSDLWYFNWALTTSEILKVVRDGPNVTLAEPPSNALSVFPPYLSLRWYFGGK